MAAALLGADGRRAARDSDDGRGRNPRGSPLPIELAALRGALRGVFEGVRMNGQKPLLVVIDDEQGILDVVGRFAQRAGYEAVDLLERARRASRSCRRGAPIW